MDFAYAERRIRRQAARAYLIVVIKMQKWINAILNTVSMITVPTGTFALALQPLDLWGWFLLAVGFGVQVVKYYKE